MEGTKKKKAVQFGAGNIGRGCMGQLLWEAGFEITFVDADKQLVALLNDRGQYPLQLLDAYSKKSRTVVIDSFTAIATSQRDKVAKAVMQASLVTTAVGVKNLEAVSRLLAEGLGQRFEQNPIALDIFLCENMFGAVDLLEKQVFQHLPNSIWQWATKNIGFVGTSVARMVASDSQQRQEEPLLIAENQSTHHIMDHIVREVFSVMTIAGYETPFQMPEAFLDVFYGKLVPDTAGHRSSSLQDIKAGRRTEIEALNGAVIKLAKRHGIDAPYNSVAFHLVKSLEARNL